MNARETVVSRGLHLEYLTVAWNTLEALLALVFGTVAGSIALLGFGLDSIIEVSSGTVLLWRLRSDHNPEHRERVEHRALRLVGISFLALAAYIVFESSKTLLQRQAPEASVPGIALAAAALIVMPLLARAKRCVASSLGSSALHADSRQADFCAYLSAITLGGLLLNAAFHWWWADPIAGLAMAPLIAKEGIEALQGKTCCQADTSLANSGALDARN
jgi:divalent metal cation (Fe/Co/Zn/Cd) transporter